MDGAGRDYVADERDNGRGFCLRAATEGTKRAIVHASIHEEKPLPSGKGMSKVDGPPPEWLSPELGRFPRPLGDSPRTVFGLKEPLFRSAHPHPQPHLLRLATADGALLQRLFDPADSILPP
jgi:hypothetical protein